MKGIRPSHLHMIDYSVEVISVSLNSNWSFCLQKSMNVKLKVSSVYASRQSDREGFKAPNLHMIDYSEERVMWPLNI